MVNQLKVSTPADPELDYLLGEIYAELGNFAESRSFYQQAVSGYRDRFRRNEPDVSTLVKITRCLTAIGSYQKAEACLKKLIEMTPAMPAAHYQLGQLFEALDHGDIALKAYRQCLKLQSDHRDALLAYSSLMADRGRLDKTAWAYRRLLMHTPQDASLRHMLNASLPQKGSDSVDERYVKDVFDDYAENFDDHLVNTLNYHVPEKLFALFGGGDTSPAFNTIDLGCGTGLCGLLFGPC